MTSGANEVPSRLQRSLGTRGAVVVGLSAMLGTGVFVVWTPALTLAGSQLLVALALATVVAALNASSTARLARIIPESGGAYAYGRKLLSRPVGVLAGLVFVIGKAASASAAALAIGVYLWPEHDRFIAWLAIGIALAIDLRGVVKSMSVSALLVALVLMVILLVTIAGARAAHSATFTPLPATVLGVVAASGLLFVAFAGYARITVLGALYLTVVALIPEMIHSQLNVSQFIGGTSLLIMVTVTLDTISQVQSHLIAQQYEGLVKRSRLGGGGRRR